MGYTHYLYRAPELEPAHYTAFAAEARTLLRDIDAILVRDHGTGLAGPQGTGAVVVTDELVSFNGAAPSDYETCRIERSVAPDDYRRGDPDDHGRVFSFCKTAYKPYDAAVTAVYALAVDHFGAAVAADSDGGPEAIEEGRQLASRLLGRQLRGAAA
jgi:hypothetical protein